MFDDYIDQYSINPDDFTITRDGNGAISSTTLSPGEIDGQISRSVLLSLVDPISDSTEELSLKYTQGDLSGFLSGVVNTSAEIDVSNEVSVDLTEVLLSFEDGSLSFEDILINASWKVDPLQMYDDGSHGDTVANDNNWATTVSLVDDKYNWDVFSRVTVVAYDTTKVVDTETGVITLVITPYAEYIDSILSENVVLEFEVTNTQITGDTSFGIMNIPVTFIVELSQPSEEVFLMGIEDDWGQGILMSVLGESIKYTSTLEGYTEGDVIEYNYRDGNNWENQTVEPRSYVVIKGENIVNDIFGEFTTSLKEFSQSDVTLYPNPVSGTLNLSGLEDVNSLEIYNL